jgi:hypothetical protein
MLTPAKDATRRYSQSSPCSPPKRGCAWLRVAPCRCPAGLLDLRSAWVPAGRQVGTKERPSDRTKERGGAGPCRRCRRCRGVVGSGPPAVSAFLTPESRARRGGQDHEVRTYTSQGRCVLRWAENRRNPPFSGGPGQAVGEMVNSCRIPFSSCRRPPPLPLSKPLAGAKMAG